MSHGWFQAHPRIIFKKQEALRNYSITDIMGHLKVEQMRDDFASSKTHRVEMAEVLFRAGMQRSKCREKEVHIRGRRTRKTGASWFFFECRLVCNERTCSLVENWKTTPRKYNH